MAYESNIITFIGNLTDDPELRFLQNGAALCEFTLANNRKWRNKDGEEQEDTTFLKVTCWRDMGNNVAETLRKGDRAIAIGRLRIDRVEDGAETKWYTKLEADEVAPSLKWARAALTKMSGGEAQQPKPPPPSDDIPF